MERSYIHRSQAQFSPNGISRSTLYRCFISQQSNTAAGFCLKYKSAVENVETMQKLIVLFAESGYNIPHMGTS
jgi:hypothetical protein